MPGDPGAQQDVEHRARGEPSPTDEQGHHVDHQPDVRDGDRHAHGVGNGGGGCHSDRGQEQQRQHVDTHDEEDGGDPAHDGRAGGLVDEVHDGALPDVVVDGGEQIRRASHQQHIREAHACHEPSERLPDGERVAEVNHGDEAEGERDPPSGGPARCGQHLVDRDATEEQKEDAARDHPSKQSNDHAPG